MNYLITLLGCLLLAFSVLDTARGESGTATAFGERTGGLHPDSSPSPSPVGQPDHIQVISAVYGSGTHFADVTARVIECFNSPKGACWATPDSLKVDPTPGWNKCLVIIYDLDGTHHLFTMGEWGKVTRQKMIENLGK